MKIEDFLSGNKQRYSLLNKEGDKYIASIATNGTVKIEVANIKVIGQSQVGITQPKIVSVDSNLKGFLKNSAVFDDSDDLELIINFLGNLFEIPMAKEYRIFDSDLKKEALLSIDVAEHGNEKFTELFSVMLEAGEGVINKTIPMLKWMNGWIKLNSQPAFPENRKSHEFMCIDDEDYDTAIQLPINILRTYYPNYKESIKKFEKNYYDMIIFDIFIGQTDRNMNNYGIICNGSDYRFAPLFDNSTLAKPYLPRNMYSLNTVVMDREELFSRLTKGYLQYVKEPIQKIVSLYAENKTTIFELIDMWIDNNNKELIKKNVEAGYSLFKNI